MKIHRAFTPVLPLLALSAAAVFAPPCQAALINWTGGNGDWLTGSNWSGGAVPNIAGADDATINPGTAASVTYAPGANWTVGAGRTVTVAGGSSLTQSGAAPSRVQGTMTLNGGTYARTDTTTGNPNNYLSISATGAGATLNVLNGSSLNLGFSRLIIGGDGANALSNAVGVVNLVNSTITTRELWFNDVTAPATGGPTGITSTLNISNSHIVTAGDVGIWFWRYETANNHDFTINFTGPAGSSIELGDQYKVGINRTGNGNNQSWQTAWDLGLLTYQGQGVNELGSAAFSTLFNVQTTAPAPGSNFGRYILTLSVPEPSAALMGACGLLGFLRRRR